MQPAVSPPSYDEITDRVARSIQGLEPGEWVERHHLRGHVSSRTIKDVIRLPIVPAQGGDGAVVDRVLDDALEKLRKWVGWESRTLDGVVAYRFGPPAVPAPGPTPAPPEATSEPVESPAPAEDVETVLAPKDEATVTGRRPPTGDGAGGPGPQQAGNGQKEETIVQVRVQDLRPHPAHQKVPPMRPQEWEGFLEDVRRRGVIDPVTVQRGGVLIDGTHRLRAARESGQEFLPARVVDWAEDEQLDHVYRAATRRRHLTDDQRAVLAAEWAEVMAAQSRSERARKAGRAGGRGRGKKGDGAPATDPGLTPAAKAPSPPAESVRAQAAREFGVPERKLKDSQGLRKAHPALADEVRAGAKTLQKARREARRQGGAAAPARPQGPPPRGPGRKGGAPKAPTPTPAAGHGALVLELPEKSPRALLGALVVAFGCDEAASLLRAALDLAEEGGAPAPGEPMSPGAAG